MEEIFRGKIKVNRRDLTLVKRIKGINVYYLPCDKSPQTIAVFAIYKGKKYTQKQGFNFLNSAIDTMFDKKKKKVWANYVMEEYCELALKLVKRIKKKGEK